MYQNDFLPRGEIFSVFYKEHLKQAKALFNVFYYAKDFETFYKTAVWARQNVNEGIFVYALSVAVVHRDDTYGIVLPPIYEVYPYYFFPSEVIEKVQTYKQTYNYDLTGYKPGKGYIIPANYTGYYLGTNTEQYPSYFTEDIGLNAYYYYYNIYYPSWLNGEEFGLKNDRRGEQFYYFHQQLLARYYLERLSNGLGEIPYFNYNDATETEFYPSLVYPNGLQFPSRPIKTELYKSYDTSDQSTSNYYYAFSYEYIQDYERRIRDAVDSGYVWTVSTYIYLTHFMF